MTMNTSGHERIHLRAGIEVVVVTGRVLMVRQKRSLEVNRYIYFQVNVWVGTPVDELKGHCAD